MRTRDMQLPFAHLNLRRNPFGEVPADEAPELAVIELDLPALAERLRRPGFAIQLLGDCGHGKSTHLRALHRHFADLPYTQVDEGQRPAIPTAHVIFVDESQRVPRRARARLFRRQASFALGTHEDHRRELRRAGLDWVTFEVGGLAPGKLAAIVERRLAWARRAPGPVPRLATGATEWLVERFGDDVRAIIGLLYEVYQQLQEVGDVEVHALDRARGGGTNLSTRGADPRQGQRRGRQGVPL